MYRMGETCTLNPLQFGGFSQELRPEDLNMTGDFINFDFTSTQFNDFFSHSPAPAAGEDTNEMECALSEEIMPTYEPSIKVEMPEESSMLSGLMVPPAQSQYNEDMDQVQELIVRDVMDDIVTACQLIDIPTDPYRWNSEQVQKWVEWTRHQYRLPEIEIGFFTMDGMRLCSLTDEQFRQILPKSGDILYAHLDIWKNAAKMKIAEEILSPCNPVSQFPVDEGCNYLDLSSLAGYETSSSVSNSDDEASIPSPGPSGPNTFMTPNHTGGIHLWQFLKELLLQPDSYGYCIRWLDRSQGIFKIEDSVEVARLWGLRKNRPAMNYDKLSRSIRQYYKKGIMKKTEVAQRLVYQFVHPC
ncbi:SAM pointed domain-containing Ets transcription factor-like [Acanthaster planci]|uniref:SAM pointed domain-containing Ets transcription factor-like n=1 Tax=Acanthaster planci TaxID=133434 RepID=A0A8B7XRT7_ACAPL|nr:SAM pointed domain-containing Ets transcription factor-like [Acanthaster planci]